ncbi:peptidoglycan DD-metalloendopeptidase family protein [Bacteroidales bacterium OttesenSCG-928-C03]|nr:peptidoglycan DD-metalloendopeptidase family protein [Bacteroidales bacterium OttesenSCG-928-C03]MDL2325932.1 peptidoglycan DD-metalloendopeptidase family protein [Bacteroidales bacterium OttesenSCG-928-A14]
MNIKKIVLSTIFSLLIFTISAQTNCKDNQLDINVVNGKTIVPGDSLLVDSLGFDLSYDDDTKIFDDIPYNGPALHFIYFDWMPGHGTYTNFEVTQIHYKHEGAVAPDTLIFGEYSHPAPFKVTSNYGWRRKRMHYGVDLGYPTGTPVVAAFDGIIRVSRSNAGGYGNLIVIRHENGLETYYGHLSKRLVNPGQLVNAGDTIGLGGNTGRSYGSHLHFETRYLGAPFNPNTIIDFDSMRLKCDSLYVKGCATANNIAANTTTKANTSSATLAASDAVYYKVKNGDTLSHIARRYGTSVTRIKKMNNLRSDFLRVGQRLRVK